MNDSDFDTLQELKRFCLRYGIQIRLTERFRRIVELISPGGRRVTLRVGVPAKLIDKDDLRRPIVTISSNARVRVSILSDDSAHTLYYGPLHAIREYTPTTNRNEEFIPW